MVQMLSVSKLQMKASYFMLINGEYKAFFRVQLLPLKRVSFVIDRQEYNYQRVKRGIFFSVPKAPFINFPWAFRFKADSIFTSFF
jgi:hypothetical protein